MKNHTRPVIAAIGGALVNNASYTHVYDHGVGAFRTIGCKISSGNVEAYDYDNGVHISGSLPSSVYHYGDSGFLEVKHSGSKFEGYDYLTGTFFEGSVSGHTINLYDYETASFYSYSLS